MGCGGPRALEEPQAERYGGGRRSAVGAEMTAAEIGWEVAMLGRISRLLLRGRTLSGWRCYTDLSKYRSARLE